MSFITSLFDPSSVTGTSLIFSLFFIGVLVFQIGFTYVRMKRQQRIAESEAKEYEQMLQDSEKRIKDMLVQLSENRNEMLERLDRVSTLTDEIQEARRLLTIQETKDQEAEGKAQAKESTVENATEAP